MGQPFALLSVWLRIAIYAAVWLLVFLPGRSTIAFVSGAVISYSAARRGLALHRGAPPLPRDGLTDPLAAADGRWRAEGAQEICPPFAFGYDLYSPSESRWIYGGGDLNYSTGDALFDYLHF